MTRYSFQRAKSHFWHLWYRAQFYLDFRSIARILRYRKLRQKYYDRLWTQAAKNMDAHIDVNSHGFTKISKDGWSTFVDQHQMMFDSPLMLEVMGNKALTYELLSDAQAPVVPHEVFSVLQLDEARDFLKTHNVVVVKPASGTGGGRGVTTSISSQKQLISAARLAARFDRKLIVEKQIEGQNYRLLYLDGEFIDAIRRDPPHIVGDGKSTIKQLIKQENKRREFDPETRALSPLVRDNDMKNWMKSNHLGLSDVPPNNKSIQVKRATNENNKDENVNVTNLVSEEIISQCSKLVVKLGVKFAGVDLICLDIAGPFSTENCYVGEINTTPGIHHHDLIANRDAGKPVAESALNYLYSRQIGFLGSSSNIAKISPPSMHSSTSEEIARRQEDNYQRSATQKEYVDEPQ